MRSLLMAALSLTFATAATAQQTRDIRRELEGFTPAPLRFTPPEPRRVTLSNGVPVYLLADRTLPLLDVQILSKVGTNNVPDSLWGVAWLADGLLRSGGTRTLTPDSLDKLVEFYAISISFGTGYEQSNAFASGLSRDQNVMLDLLFDMMRNPRNDTAQIKVTIAQNEENWRRRNDQPFSIANRAWNQIMLGNHPLARTLTTPDELAGFTPARLRWVQERIFCPQNLSIGVTGDFEERDMLRQLEQRFRGWGRCAAGLEPLPAVRIAAGPRVVHIEKDINQSSIQLGHTGGIKVADDPRYFAAQVADFLLGGGGGFNSRLLQQVRSDSGFAYSVFSFWDADVKQERIFFAGAQTRADKTVAATRMIRDIIGSMASDPPTARDVKLAQDAEVNSFVFGFQSPAQVVSRRLSYEIDGLPPDWLDRYIRGIQAVTPEQVASAAREYLHPDRLVILVVGKAAAFDAPLNSLGEVTEMPVEQIVR